MKILIATDGSKYSRSAVKEYGKFISAAESLEIKIIAVVERMMPMLAEPFGASSDFYLQAEADLRKQLLDSLAEAEKIISESFADNNGSVKSEIFSGNAKKIIVEEAENFDADLIVVGSHGYGFLDRVMIGSVSDFVIHHAPCSVLVVRVGNE